ncbi:MAG TPA: deoxyhypusine synthase family protein [Thermoanaerobaculia bacterium]|nr:deoxyhypusine synthase family protein [Thermoanaerobaculia bacterium]
MESKRKKPLSAREFAREAASGVDRKRKRALLARPTTPVTVGPATTVAELLESYRGASFQARALGKCAAVFEAMLTDRQRPTIFLGLAGSLIAAGMRQVIVDLIEENMVDVVVSTGAIISQDLYQVRGGRHYHGDSHADDKELRDLYIDRLYDTFIDEEKYWETDLEVSDFADRLAGQSLSSRAFLELLAETARADRGSILGACARHGVPLFVPALNDSSIGIGLTEHYHRLRSGGREPFQISSIRDNYELTQIVVQSPATAALYVSGGVPKNYINDSIVMSYIFGVETGGHRYALQITTDAPHWGGLGGSTLSEATSWGKISKQATHEMAFVETSVALPLLYGYALQKKAANGRQRLQYTWEGDILKKVTRV